ncbi:uncharacterized protein LOC128175345 [Crassostrea angulata]|uniref:uncharacterized protein n=1 Tax=Magallana gigas TaxID=29159 RepID=UPI0022B143A0|nr:uncharacterized protein LOC128175345 [Crassostrea angulata]
MKDLMKYVMISTVISCMMMNTVAMTTNNRVLLGGVLVASALAASNYGDYIFSPLELATLTTVVLVLNFPRKESSESCTAPGYTADTVLGCYRLYINEPKSNTDARQQCANDGGRLLLLNSEAEYDRVKSLIDENSLSGVWLQGLKSSTSSPWLADNGDPLPYLGPNYIDYPPPPTLGFFQNSRGETGGEEITSPAPFFCEI